MAAVSLKLAALYSARFSAPLATARSDYHLEIGQE